MRPGRVWRMTQRPSKGLSTPPGSRAEARSISSGAVPGYAVDGSNGVELRGPLAAESTELRPIRGRAFSWATTERVPRLPPRTRPCSLSPQAPSLRGFDIGYPEQGYGSAAAPVLTYPFAIRGTGADVRWKTSP